MIWIAVGPSQTFEPGGGVGKRLSDPVLLRAFCESIIEQNYKSFPAIFLADAPAEDEHFDWAPPYILRQISRRWQDETRRREALAA
jgi:hypothetical protein